MHWLKALFSWLAPFTAPEGVPLHSGFCSSSTCVIDSKKVVVIKIRGIANHIYDTLSARLVKELTDEQPAGLIVDLREVQYSYGDDMGRVLCPAGEYDVPHCPMVIITSELNRDGLTSLVRDEWFSKPVLWLVEREEEAWALMQSKLRHEDRKRKRKAPSAR